jgi:hypothetical protein
MSGGPLYHGTAGVWDFKEGDELTPSGAEDTGVRNYDIGYEGRVHATFNLSHAQFYATQSSVNAPMDNKPTVYEVSPTDASVHDDPNGGDGDVVSTRFKILREVPGDHIQNELPY